MNDRQDRTAEVLASMLTENTGRHFLDSGGAYGRHWERNQGRDFSGEEHASLSWRWVTSGEEARPDLTLNLYHWLLERVEYDPIMDRRFHAFSRLHPDLSWMELMYQFPSVAAESNNRRQARQRSGWRQERAGESYGENSYNGESLLSQVIQWQYFTLDDDHNGEYLILQIHGGCDVRGGYTSPRVFTGNGRRDLAEIMLPANGWIGCSLCGAFWATDNAWNWCGSWGKGIFLELDKMTGIGWNCDLDMLQDHIMPVIVSIRDLLGYVPDTLRGIDLETARSFMNDLADLADQREELKRLIDLYAEDPEAAIVADLVRHDLLHIAREGDLALCPICLNGHLEGG